MPAHRLHETRSIGILGTLDVPGRPRAFGRSKRVECGKRLTTHCRSHRAWDVRCDHAPSLRLRQLDHRAVIGAVTIPRPPLREEIRLADPAGEILVEQRLCVALEHLE